MIVAGSAFHGGVNLGANLNGAINFATVNFIRVKTQCKILKGGVNLGENKKVKLSYVRSFIGSLVRLFAFHLSIYTVQS